MWAQLITFNIKPGHEQDLPAMIDDPAAAEQDRSGLLRTMVLRDQANPADPPHLRAVRERGEGPGP